MEESMSLYEILQLLKRRIKLIAAISLASAICAAIFSYFLLPEVYETSTQLLVSQENTEESQMLNTTIETDLQLLQTYSALVYSPVITEQVVDQLNLEQSSEELSQQVVVESIENSQLLEITVEDNDPATAVAIANTIAEVLQKEVQELMNMNNITILSAAKTSVSSLPVAPDPLMNIFLGMIAGLILGVGLAFILEYLDTSIKTGQEVKAFLDVPLIGSISAIPIEKERKAKVAAPLEKKEA